MSLKNKKICKTVYDEMKKIDILKIKSMQITYCMLLSNVIIITALIFIKDSFFKETVFTFLTIWSFLFLFFIIGLYKGIRIIKKKMENKQNKNTNDSWKNHIFEIDFALILDHGIIGFIIGIFASCIFAIIMFIVISLIFPMISEVGIFIMTGINFAVTRLFRKVLILRKKCRENLVESLKYSFIYSAIYTAMIFVVYLVGEEVVKQIII